MPTHTLPSHPSAILERLMLEELGTKPQLQASLLLSEGWGSSDLADTVSAHVIPCPCWLGHLLPRTAGPQGNQGTSPPPALYLQTSRKIQHPGSNTARQSPSQVTATKSKHKKQVIRFRWLLIKPSWLLSNTCPQLREFSPGDRSGAQPSEGGISHPTSSLCRHPCAMPGSPGSNPHTLVHIF